LTSFLHLRKSVLFNYELFQTYRKVQEIIKRTPAHSLLNSNPNVFLLESY
jgi:hypothetical protein